MKIDVLGISIVLTVVGVLSMPYWKPPLDKVVMNALDNPYKCNMVGLTNDGLSISGHAIIKESELKAMKSKNSVLNDVELYPYLEFNNTFSTNAVPTEIVKSALVLCEKI